MRIILFTLLVFCTTSFAAYQVPDLSVTAAKIGLNALRGYIDGLTASTAGASQTITIAAGSAIDNTNAQMMVLTSSFSKSLNGVWAAGSGSNGLDVGSVAPSTTYHVWLIKNPTTKAVDVLLSLSPSAPTMPSGYTLKRRIFSAYTTAGSNWVTFQQIGDTVHLATTVEAYRSVTTAVNANTTMVGIPTGINVQMHGFIECAATNSNTPGYGFIGSPFTSAITTGTIAVGVTTYQTGYMCTGGYFNTGPAGVIVLSIPWFSLWTNTSAQLRLNTVMNAGTLQLVVTVEGWIDARGKDGLL